MGMRCAYEADTSGLLEIGEPNPGTGAACDKPLQPAHSYDLRIVRYVFHRVFSYAVCTLP
jgi:hypothetical protein